MDEYTQEAPPAKNNKNFIKLIGIEAIVLLIIVVIVTVVLNYFNIFSLSQMNPQLFGRLPHQPYIVETNAADITPSPTFPPVREEVKAELDRYSSIFSSSNPAELKNTVYFPAEVKNSEDLSYYSSLSTFTSGISRATVLGYNSSGEAVDRQIVINHIPPTEEALNPSGATVLASTYLGIAVGGNFLCAPPKEYSNTRMHCESVWREGPIQRSINIAQIGDIEIGINYCEVESESPLLANKVCAPGLD